MTQYISRFQRHSAENVRRKFISQFNMLSDATTCRVPRPGVRRTVRRKRLNGYFICGKTAKTTVMDDDPKIQLPGPFCLASIVLVRLESFFTSLQVRFIARAFSQYRVVIKPSRWKAEKNSGTTSEVDVFYIYATHWVMFAFVLDLVSFRN